ncbi:MAG: hypothetical protein EOM55_00475 [Clostridia bacterium]|nr:hypothetical protein [Clostridia bacterium]
MKKSLKIFFCFSCVTFLAISPFYLFNKENYKLNLNEYFNLENSTKVVLTLYNIETFEGGTNSRTSYLQKQALKFNKKYNNCFVVIKTLSPDQLALNIRNNNLPDLYSFGVGVGSYIQGFLSELDENSQIRSCLMQYGKKFGKLLAYPYILSGYTLISYEKYLLEEENLSSLVTTDTVKNVVGLSLSSTFNGAEVLFQNGITLSESDIMETSSSYDAYKNFLSKKTKSLLGTARDLARCKNREDLGTLGACDYKFLGNYSDLVQYISVVESGSSAKMLYAKEFAKFLTDENSQNDLSDYGLFSTLKNNIYNEGYMLEFENVLRQELSSVSAFISVEDMAQNVACSKEKLF